MSAFPSNGPFRPMTDPIPPTEDVASLPRKERRSATKLAQFTLQQYHNALALRAAHAESWIKVKSIMRGLHYFRVRNGVWQPLSRKPGEERAFVPVMEPEFRLELGRLNSNRLGVTAIPKLGLQTNAGFKAKRAEAILNHWIDEIELAKVYDQSNQDLLYYGDSALLRYIDRFRQNVMIESVPGPELFPIPFDATSPEKADGIMRVKIVTREWLEMQDEAYERKHGTPRERPMTRQSSKTGPAMSINSAGLGGMYSFGGSTDGATAMWVWMKPNELFPSGEHFLVIGDTLYGYAAGYDEQTGENLAMLDGKIPLEFIHYTKKPDDFWSTGFCEPLIAAQREANRQWSSVIESARFNKPNVGYDPDMVDPRSFQGPNNRGFFPLKTGVLADAEGRPPWHVIPAIPQGSDVTAVLQASLDFARRAVGHESAILFGQQEGRTEGGPATGMLNANAQAPLQPVIDRIRNAHARMYPAVLDLLRRAWPAQKRIRVTGPANIGRELVIERDHQVYGIPASEEVELIPMPLMAGGRNALMSLLFQMRQMPGDDGQRPMLTEREFRRSLLQLGANPPGIDMVDRTEERLLYRIGQLINDGQRVGARPIDQFGPLEMDAFRAEDHGMAVDLLREYILDPGFEMYSPQVRHALLNELRAHMEMAQGVQTINFDDDAEMVDALQAERFLYHAEQALDTDEGLIRQMG